MKIAKILLTLTTAALLGCLALGCVQRKAPFTPKPVDGQAPVFDDGTSYYSVAPSVMQTDANTRYVYYTANVTANESDSGIAVRKSVLNGDGWTYGDRVNLLAPSVDGWDSQAVSDPAVIKGSFGYNGQTYSYLMAYQGRTSVHERNHSIGFAVSHSPDSGFVRVAGRILRYDPRETGNAYGYGAPSLVSYDQASKFRMFYTLVDSAGLPTQYFVEIDGSDLGRVDASGWQALIVNGLRDGAADGSVEFRDADFALDGDGNLVTVRNKYPTRDVLPLLPKAVQVAAMPIDYLYSTQAANAWTIVAIEVTSFDVADFENGLTGWQCVYSPALVRDAYGTLYGNDIGLFLTVTAFDGEGAYRFNQTLVETKIEYGGLEVQA